MDRAQRLTHWARSAISAFSCSLAPAGSTSLACTAFGAADDTV
jgi:hypothetical protein